MVLPIYDPFHSCFLVNKNEVAWKLEKEKSQTDPILEAREDIDDREMGGSWNGGTPNGLFISWKILLKWMIWEYPCFWKPPNE